MRVCPNKNSLSFALSSYAKSKGLLPLRTGKEMLHHVQHGSMIGLLTFRHALFVHKKGSAHFDTLSATISQLSFSENSFLIFVLLALIYVTVEIRFAQMFFPIAIKHFIMRLMKIIQIPIVFCVIFLIYRNALHL